MANINNTPVGKLANKEKFADRNIFCSIREFGPQDTDRGVLFIGSMFHRTQFAGGNFQKIITDEFGARYAHVDYPKKEFDIQKVREQLIDYISKSKQSEIVLVGLSFGEKVAVDLMQTLPPAIKSKIKRNLSLAGVSEYDQLDKGQKIMVNGLSLVSSKARRAITSCLGFLDKRFGNPISKGGVARHGTAGTHKLERHRRAAAMGITPGLGDRLQAMKDMETQKGSVDIPIAAMYSQILNDKKGGDVMFPHSEQNATATILQSTNPESIAIKVPDGGHAALAEFPDRWDKHIKDFFEKMVGWTPKEDK